MKTLKSKKINDFCYVKFENVDFLYENTSNKTSLIFKSKAELILTDKPENILITLEKNNFIELQVADYNNKNQPIKNMLNGKIYINEASMDFFIDYPKELVSEIYVGNNVIKVEGLKESIYLKTKN